ncbi:poly-gamma-glutamate synthase PgsB [Sulfitobacter faviae]|uniref:Poly-gamma-glutamate synthase PgsB n=1 Tax=Sulfitobacter faviae TaxID=1775881 RepID=A0ABZ0V1F5_9RHOB|nr:poly-gamma-glutamate synthase PgsB [Sulfitobacter faviae]WPZ22279.1 poly-gamma-glutamate synthase PgsB [Sulfitobacter faviae]
MMEEWTLFALATAASFSVILYWSVQTFLHNRRISRVPIRIHVNGTRGKSTIVRYIAASLRAGGIETLAKTTGSATMLIDEEGEERPIHRNGAPTIIEQIEILAREQRPSTEAVVFECMALNTGYQWVSEHRIMQSTTGVIGNVRHDHVEQLGETLPEIARSLSNSAPRGKPLFTAETNPEIVEILKEESEAVGGELIASTAETITDADMKGFHPLAFKENIALALEVALAHGVDREVALEAMRNTARDPGASEIHRHERDGQVIWWANFFGVNDVASADINIEKTADWLGANTETIFLLNGRSDRQDRTLDFGRYAAESDRAVDILLAGEAREPLHRTIEQASEDHPKVIDFGVLSDDPEAILDEVFDLARSLNNKAEILIAGMANIHTEDAKRLMAALESPQSEYRGGSAHTDRKDAA